MLGVPGFEFVLGHADVINSCLFHGSTVYNAFRTAFSWCRAVDFVSTIAVVSVGSIFVPTEHLFVVRCDD